MEKRRTIEIAAFILLAGAAVTGWARHTDPVTPAATPELNTTVSPVAANQPPSPYGASGQASTLPEPMTAVPQNYPVPIQRTSAYRTAYTPVTPAAAPYGSEVYSEVRPYRRGRSTGKSVAIVAGSAGVGAAVGALAHGGKGAGIGALAGGGAGFLYDRLTHKTHSGL